MAARHGFSSRYVVVRYIVALFLVLSSSCLLFAARRLLVVVCWWQDLELRARDRYSALDQMSAELRQLQEQRDALDALVETLRTRDGWLAYRAGALRDQLLEPEGQPTPRASAVERVRTALIDRDEALQQVRQDLERARSVAADWEAEVVSVRAQRQRDRTELERRGPGKVRQRRGRGRPSRRARRLKR
jgi:chromosome segregation ATPase